MTPPTPVNVRLEHPDGRVIPIELAYVGVQQGQHVWAPVAWPSEVHLDELWNVRVEELPAKTSIRLPFALP